MFCNCENPKKMENDADGKKFYVCAKSNGGCGCEISENKPNVVYGMDLKLNIDGEDVTNALEVWTKNLGF